MTFPFFTSAGSRGLPPIPTREQLCTAKSSFQGLTANLPSFGAVPYTDGVVTSPAMTLADRQAGYTCKHAAGDTCHTINLTWNYDELGLPFNPPGRDLSHDLPTFKAYVREIIEAGFPVVEIDLGGDGLSVDPHGNRVPDGYTGPFGYNDPVGWTYGFQWLMATFPAIYASLGPTPEDAADLRPYCRWRPGYDGVVPGWAGPENDWHRVNQWADFCRSVIGLGVSVIELSAGYWAWSGESDDWNDQPAGMNFDLVQYEFPVPMQTRAPWQCGENTTDQVLQIAKRLCGPTYQRPAGLPGDYDPGYLRGDGPLAQDCDRGPRYVMAYELATYDWVRRRITLEQINQHRADLAAMGWPLVC